MPLASVAASQDTTIEVSDSGVATTFVGTVGAVVSVAGGGGGGGPGGELSSPPPPHADRVVISDNSAALVSLDCMWIVPDASIGRCVPGNLPAAGGLCRQTPSIGMGTVRRRRADFPAMPC